MTGPLGIKDKERKNNGAYDYPQKKLASTGFFNEQGTPEIRMSARFNETS
jgi:hypothetical protein